MVPATLRADVVGDTYSFGLTGFNAAGNSGAFVSPGGVITSTFTDGSNTVLGTSAFGNAGDTLNLFESSTVTGDTIDISISVIAFDSTGALTNWFADGSTAPDGSPFQLAFLDLADFNGGTDKLDPTFSGTTKTAYQIDSAGFFFVGTGGGLFGPGGNPFDWADTSDATGLSGSAGVNFGSDISTAAFAGQEFAGYQVDFTVTVIPEPATAGFALLMLGAVATRRRKR